MRANEYQEAAHVTGYYETSVDEMLYGKDELLDTSESVDPARKFLLLAYPAGKLNGEAGEFIEEVMKSLRDSAGNLQPRHDKLVDELGDVLWYVAECATRLGITLEDLMKHNLAKVVEKNEKKRNAANAAQ